MVTFDEIWNEEFAPKLSEKLAKQSMRQAESFLETTLTVCGEPIRQMTPDDLLLLDGFECPFVCGCSDSEITGIDRAFFIWQLHENNTHTGGPLNYFRRGRVLGRLAKRDLASDIAEIREFCARMFADIPSAEEEIAGDEILKRPPSLYFLATLLTNVARDIGPIDPMSGNLLSKIPLPRLFQYQRASGRYDERDSEIASLRSQCLARLNEINAPSRN